MSRGRKRDPFRSWPSSLMVQKLGKEQEKGKIMVFAGSGEPIYGPNAKVDKVLDRLERSVNEQGQRLKMATTPEERSEALANIESLEQQIQRIQFGYELNPAD